MVKKVRVVMLDVVKVFLGRDKMNGMSGMVLNRINVVKV